MKKIILGILLLSFSSISYGEVKFKENGEVDYCYNDTKLTLQISSPVWLALHSFTNGVLVIGETVRLDLMTLQDILKTELIDFDKNVDPFKRTKLGVKFTNELFKSVVSGETKVSCKEDFLKRLAAAEKRATASVETERNSIEEQPGTNSEPEKIDTLKVTIN